MPCVGYSLCMVVVQVDTASTSSALAFKDRQVERDPTCTNTGNVIQWETREV